MNNILRVWGRTCLPAQFTRDKLNEFIVYVNFSSMLKISAVRSDRMTPHTQLSVVFQMFGKQPLPLNPFWCLSHRTRDTVVLNDNSTWWISAIRNSDLLHFTWSHKARMAVCTAPEQIVCEWFTYVGITDLGLYRPAGFIDILGSGSLDNQEKKENRRISEFPALITFFCVYLST